MLIIERFEGNIAIIEADNGHMELNRTLLPAKAKEGDVLTLINGQYLVDTEKTAQRRSAVINKLRKMGL